MCALSSRLPALKLTRSSQQLPARMGSGADKRTTPVKAGRPAPHISRSRAHRLLSFRTPSGSLSYRCPHGVTRSVSLIAARPNPMRKRRPWSQGLLPLWPAKRHTLRPQPASPGCTQPRPMGMARVGLMTMMTIRKKYSTAMTLVTIQKKYSTAMTTMTIPMKASHRPKPARLAVPFPLYALCPLYPLCPYHRAHHLTAAWHAPCTGA